jgi:hypothetical protein
MITKTTMFKHIREKNVYKKFVKTVNIIEKL